MRGSEVYSLSAEQLRALANPLRESILALLCCESLSATRIAERLDDPPGNVHYHLARLRAVGLIELVEERRVRGATEKMFRAVASDFSVGPGVLAGLPGPGAESGVMPGIRRHADRVLGDLERALSGPAGVDPPLSSHQRLRLRPRTAARLRARLLEWLEDCRAADAGAAAGEETLEEWLLLAAFFRRAPEQV